MKAQDFQHDSSSDRPFRSVARKENGAGIVIAAWQSFDKAVGCCYGFFAAEKLYYEQTKKLRFSSVCVKRLDASGWNTVPNSLLQLDFAAKPAVAGKVEVPSYTEKGRSFQCGECCKAMLLARKTRRGGWIASIIGTDLEGPIANSAAVPTNLEPGTVVVLKIAALGSNGQYVHFNWLPQGSLLPETTPNSQSFELSQSLTGGG